MNGQPRHLNFQPSQFGQTQTGYSQGHKPSSKYYERPVSSSNYKLVSKKESKQQKNELGNLRTLETIYKPQVRSRIDGPKKVKYSANDQIKTKQINIGTVYQQMVNKFKAPAPNISILKKNGNKKCAERDRTITSQDDVNPERIRKFLAAKPRLNALIGKNITNRLAQMTPSGQTTYFDFKGTLGRATKNSLEKKDTDIYTSVATPTFSNKDIFYVKEKPLVMVNNFFENENKEIDPKKNDFNKVAQRFPNFAPSAFLNFADLIQAVEREKNNNENFEDSKDFERGSETVDLTNVRLVTINENTNPRHKNLEYISKFFTSKKGLKKLIIEGKIQEKTDSLKNSISDEPKKIEELQNTSKNFFKTKTSHSQPENNISKLANKAFFEIHYQPLQLSKRTEIRVPIPKLDFSKLENNNETTEAAVKFKQITKYFKERSNLYKSTGNLAEEAFFLLLTNTSSFVSKLYNLKINNLNTKNPNEQKEKETIAEIKNIIVHELLSQSGIRKAFILTQLNKIDANIVDELLENMFDEKTTEIIGKEKPIKLLIHPRPYKEKESLYKKLKEFDGKLGPVCTKMLDKLEKSIKQESTIKNNSHRRTDLQSGFAINKYTYVENRDVASDSSSNVWNNRSNAEVKM